MHELHPARQGVVWQMEEYESLDLDLGDTKTGFSIHVISFYHVELSGLAIVSASAWILYFPNIDGTVKRSDSVQKL